MANNKRIEKIRIQRKAFADNIPFDIGHKTLEVLNE